MNDSNNPFAAPETQRKPVSRGAIVGWVIAAVAIVATVVTLVQWTRDRAHFNRERYHYEREHADLAALLEKHRSELAEALIVSQTNREFAAALNEELLGLRKEKELAGQQAKSLEAEMRAELESKDVAISKLQGKLTVTIVDRVMFDSGEAILKPDGAAVMQKIADLLAGHPELKLHVTGHTDNVPIRQSAQARFQSNWELSAARALAAVHCLTEKSGVDPRRVGAVAYGEFRPIADNATAEGRAKNRRIEVTILPDELAEVRPAPAGQAVPSESGAGPGPRQEADH
jgi:chemotaxis protein MotB